MKKFLFCIVATMFVTVTFAQHQRQHQPRQFNPEETAQRQTMALHQALQLDSIQLQAVFLINYAIGGASGWQIDLERYGNRSNMYVDYVRVFDKKD